MASVLSSSKERSDSKVVSDTEVDKWKVERKNLLNMAKLAIKGLLESSMKAGRSLDDDHGPLSQFFIIMEHVLRHGLKAKKSLIALALRKDFWAVLESLEKESQECREIVQSARNLPGIKSGIGRGRAWLRLAVMQKKLADYIALLVNKREIIDEWYDPFAVLAGEEGPVIAGLLVGLSVVDCNLCLKGDSLDKQMGVIDYSLFLKEGNYLERPPGSNEDARAMFDAPEDPNFTLVLDQKAYLEERNLKLQSTISDMTRKLESAERTNAKLASELADAQTEILTLQVHRGRLEQERDQTTVSHKMKLENAMSDIETERETYVQSRTGLNEMYLQIQKQLETEKKAREDCERDVVLQTSMKQECQMAMKLLEKDIHEKQDLVVALRKQLEDVKQLNLGMHKKHQAGEEKFRTKESENAKMKEEIDRLRNQCEQLSVSYTESEANRLSLEEALQQVSNQLAKTEALKTEFETELKIRKEWLEKLQDDLNKETVLSAALRSEKAKLSQETAEQLAKYDELQSVCDEQESALIEMGEHLQRSRQEVNSLKQVTDTIKEFEWVDDRNIKDCQQCKKTFSVARRKHHCRNCGGVFCWSCSDNTMPLPSSAKPVRVCDSCQGLLLQRYSVT